MQPSYFPHGKHDSGAILHVDGVFTCVRTVFFLAPERSETYWESRGKVLRT